MTVKKQIIGNTPGERLTNLLSLIVKIILESYVALIFIFSIGFFLIVTLLYFIFNLL